jgi:hypothetical protein
MLLLSGKVGLQRLMLPLAFVQCWCPTCKALVAVDALAYLNHMNMSIIMYLYIYMATKCRFQVAGLLGCSLTVAIRVLISLSLVRECSRL